MKYSTIEYAGFGGLYATGATSSTLKNNLFHQNGQNTAHGNFTGYMMSTTGNTISNNTTN
jgi:hypothetical protein